jgi:hypothetical protein
MIDNRHPVDAAALWMLYSALTGISNDKVLSGIDRKAMFETAMRTLGPRSSSMGKTTISGNGLPSASRRS